MHAVIDTAFANRALSAALVCLVCQTGTAAAVAAGVIAAANFVLQHIRGDVNLAWPTAEVAVMGSKGAVEIIFKREIAAAKDPAEAERRLEREYRDRFANPYAAAALGYLDDVVEPRATRPRLIAALSLLRTKRDTNPPKKHGNIPL